MKSLLIGYGQIFHLLVDAFTKSKRKFKIIGDKIPESLAFKTKDKRILKTADLLIGRRLNRGDLTDTDSIFITVYERANLLRILKAVERLKTGQPVFVVSTAISQSYNNMFPAFHFLPIQTIFRRQVDNFITQCDYLFRLDRLKSLLKPKDRVLITIFENPDPDAIASALGLLALLKKLKLSAVVTYTGEINRVQNKALIDALGVKFYRYSDINTADFDKFALVDAQPFFFKGDKKVKFNIIIDHHPVRARYKAEFMDLRPRVGATSTIMTGYLANSRTPISKKLATALLYGIKIDTNNLEQHVTESDVRAFSYLFQRADHDLLRKIELSEIPQVALPYFEYALKNKRVYKDRVYVNLGKVDAPEVHVMVADFLLRVNRISTAIISAVQDHNLIIIFRNDGQRDVGKLASLAFGKIGQAGGHKNMARAEIPCEKIKKVCKSYNKKAIDGFIFRRINKFIRET